MTIISCGIISLQLLYPLLMAGSGSSICYLYKFWKRDTKANYKAVYLAVLPFIGQALVGILEIIRARVMSFQLKPKENQEISEKIRAHSGKYGLNESKYKKCYIVAYFVVVSLINSVVIVLKSMYLIDYHLFVYNSMMIGNILFTTLITVNSLPGNTYKHHYLSIVIVILGICPFVTLDVIDQYVSFPNEDNWIDYWISIPISLLFSGQQVIEKIMIDKKFVGQYLIVTVEGLFGLIAMLTYFTVVGSFNDDSLDLFYSGIQYVPFIALAYFVLNTFRILTINYLTPIHQVIGESIIIAFSCYIQMRDFVFKKELTIYYLVFNDIGFVLIIFGFLLYNDIIIINCFKMDLHTKRELSRRGDAFKLKLNASEDSLTITDLNI